MHLFIYFYINEHFGNKKLYFIMKIIAMYLFYYIFTNNEYFFKLMIIYLYYICIYVNN